jgi:G6PDH family F420-dependent oxidoreductase
MAEIGYFLASEEHGPRELVDIARQAEAAGFRSVWIADHYHPWTDRQGQSSFVWSVIGAIGASTGLRVTTAVTCPTVRIHPAIVAQAAATVAALFPGRFQLGVGAGENLNEHILGDAWPRARVRLEMLEEAVEVMRKLWSGKLTSHEGKHYTVSNARIYSRPETPPPVLMSALGPRSIALAARIADGYMTVEPDADAVRAYVHAAGRGPKQGGVKVCWGPDEAEAHRLAHELWATECLPGNLPRELPLPRHFEDATKLVTEDQVAGKVPCGPDPERHAATIRRYLDAGLDEVYICQIGPDQAGFFDFWQRELRQRLT